jgi:hypothetical protein
VQRPDCCMHIILAPSNARHGGDQAHSCNSQEAQAVAAQQQCHTRSAGPCPGCWCTAGLPARHYGRQYGSTAQADVRKQHNH